MSARADLEDFVMQQTMQLLRRCHKNSYNNQTSVKSKVSVKFVSIKSESNAFYSLSSCQRENSTLLNAINEDHPNRSKEFCD